MLVDDSGHKHVGRVDRWSFLEDVPVHCRISFSFHPSTAGGHRLNVRSASVLHRCSVHSSWWKSSSWGWVANVTGVSCDVQDHNVLCIRTSRHVCATDKNRPAALAALRPADCMRMCVRDVLCARSVWTRNSSVAFTDVRTPPAGIGMARSFTKSEYTQPLVDPKQTLFDTNIERRPHSGSQPGG